jgi:hypothetical protein
MPCKATTTLSLKLAGSAMASEAITKAPLHKRAFREAREFVFLTAYLYITLGAVIVMKTAVLQSYGIASFYWGVAIIKALLLAKFILLGRAMKIGERFKDRALIWPTLNKSLAFLVLLVVLTVIEEAVVGLIHHRSIASALGDLFGAQLEVTAAGILIIWLALIPYCAFSVLDEALGEGRLAKMFLVAREPLERR